MAMIGEARAVVPQDGVRPGFNETGSNIAKYLFVKAVAGSAPHSVALPSAGGVAKGVTMALIADLARGDVQMRGIAVVRLSGTVARGERVKAAADGTALLATTGAYALGTCISGGATTELAEIELFDVAMVEGAPTGATGATGATGGTGATGPTGPTGATGPTS